MRVSNPRSVRQNAGAMTSTRIGFVLLALLLAGCNGTGAAVCRHGPLQTEAPARPAIVVDLDDTVVPSPLGAISALSPLGPAPAPFCDAAAVLRRFTEHYQVIYLTARPRILEAGTLAWLDDHGFPCAPVIFACTLLESGQPQAAYKAAVLSRLTARGWTLAWGIGDKPSDVAAYRSAGVPAILILGDAEDPDRAGWPVTSGEVHVVVGHDRAWREIEGVVLSQP